jgi:hypothetical protein
MTRIRIALFLILLLASLAARPVTAQAGPVILSPGQGQALQGVVTVKGSSNVPGFVSSELAFAYTGDTTDTWFVIASSSQPVDQNTLASWDTTTITDGNYVLRLRVFLANGISLNFIVRALRVRNYTAVETPTPTPLEPTAIRPTLTPTITLTPTLFPTPTGMPGNTAIITTFDLSKSIAYGGAAALVFLLILALYQKLRRL